MSEYVPAIGNKSAKIMIVGEAPGAEEVRKGEPFVGSSGQLLDSMLSDVGICREDCFITNACKRRPPGNDIKVWFPTKTAAKSEGIQPMWGRYPKAQVVEGVTELHDEIRSVQPNVIIALGDTALWATTSESGITKWRGSVMPHRALGVEPQCKVVPTYHPAAIMRQWGWRAVALHDLTRAKKEGEFPQIRSPIYEFEVRPDVDTILTRLSWIRDKLDQGPMKLSVDLETRGGHIACIGIAWSKLAAICIPFMCVERAEGYFDTPETEFVVIRAILAVICHKNARIVGQNFLYDAQYITLFWGEICEVSMDTMIAHHVCWPGLPKGLDFLSSIYCDYHLYWKDEGKEWDSSTPEEDLWVYNCKDCVVTYDVSDIIDAQIDRLGLREQYNFQMTMFRHALRAMLRGVRINKDMRATFAMELSEAGSRYEAWFQNLIGPDVHEPPKSKTAKPWYRSPQQQVRLFYDELGIKPVTNRKTGRPTADDDALKKIGKREPLLAPLTDALANYRSIGVLYSTFIKAPLDPDGRVRCSYNVAGTDTFRFSSSKNAFGGGMNLQNITSGEEEEDVKSGRHFQLPNLRKLFIPDRGYTLMATDLDRADLYVVVWEADDDELKQMLKEGVNIHVENAKTIFPGTDCSPSKLASSSYHKAKQGVHATNYGCKARTLAAELGITVREAEDFINRWLAAHPGIKRWHRRIEEGLATTRSVSNAFGYRFRFFDRIESLLPEALAWIPQSTVALIINKGWDNIEVNLPWVQVLMQVHDELVMQVPKNMLHRRSEIEEQMLITVPYEHPLVIPVGATAGPSWGECKDIDWK